ncbi:hypothetical protein QR680_018851 [Steinernema hermaphroditum]|uniref:Uncharacterized protein n=1 Tax=Steinernema hermaphroditum TaxID=289476 RepID=A0AA39HK60_9BILA|nr:hypothetical protein QR680_018851 [Steinernema hermaphroditum]
MRSFFGMSLIFVLSTLSNASMPPDIANLLDKPVATTKNTISHTNSTEEPTTNPAPGTVPSLTPPATLATAELTTIANVTTTTAKVTTPKSSNIAKVMTTTSAVKTTHSSTSSSFASTAKIRTTPSYLEHSETHSPPIWNTTKLKPSSDGLSPLVIVLIIVAVVSPFLAIIAAIVCWKKQQLCFRGISLNLTDFKTPPPMRNMFYKEGNFEQLGPLTINKLSVENDLETADNDPPVDNKHFSWDEPGNKVFEIGAPVEQVVNG